MLALIRSSFAVACAAAASLMCSSVLHAQSTSAESTPAQSAPAGDSLGEIVVTGSRIPRAGFDTLEPATVIDSKYIESRGITNVADALNEVPGFGVPVSPSGAQNAFSAGANFVNIYGLGSQRTLTLVNGRRVVSANAPIIFSAANPGVQVDLNTITTQLVDRVENISVGGAPTYGSDAIAGTTNVILKRDFEGAEITPTYGLTSEDDGERYNVSALLGTNFLDDRGNVTFSVSTDKQDGVFAIDREWAAASYFFGTNPRASNVAQFEPGRTPQNDGRVNPDTPFNGGTVGDGLPNSVLVRDSRILLYTPGGILMPIATSPNTTDGRLRGFGPNQNIYLQFAPNGDIVPYDPGYSFGGFTASGGQGYFPQQFAQITSDLERNAATLLARYEISDNVEAFFEGTFYSADAVEVLDSGDTNCCFATTGVSGQITFSNTYPFLNAQARATLAANGLTQFRLARTLVNLTNASTSADSEMMRSVVGLRGGFAIGGRPFNWEGTANLGRYESTYSSTQLNQQNFVNALNVVQNASGQIVCSPTPVPTMVYGTATGPFQPIADPNCVPLNLFGDGAASPQAIDYVTTPTSATSKQEQAVYNVNLTGSPFDLWSGPLSVNVGFEHRLERAEFLPDDFQRLALGRRVPIQTTRGQFNTDEAFAETLVPLVDPGSDLPLLKRLDLTGKFRYVDSEVNGGYTAYTLGFQWRPFDVLEFRGNKTRSLRAPAITELFTPASERFISATDPCRATALNTGPNPAVRQRNCAAFYQQAGITPPFLPATGTNIRGVQSGDPDLENEASSAVTVGFVLEPIEDLRFSLDFAEIEIDNVIALLSATDVTQGCYDDPNFDTTNPSRGNQYCGLITRDATNRIERLDVRYVNGEFLEFSGFTANLLYNLRLGAYGNLRFSATGFRPRRLESSNTGIFVDEQVGEVGNPEKQYYFNVGYEKARWGFDWYARYTGSAVYDLNDTIENSDTLRVDSHWLHNAGLSFAISDQARIRLALTNVFDEPPPPAAFVGYDILGRRYSMMVKWKFL